MLRHETSALPPLTQDEFAIEMGIDVHAANEATLEVALTAAEWMSWAAAGPPTPSQRAARDAPRSAPAPAAPAPATPLTPTPQLAPRTAGAAVGGSAGTPAQGLSGPAPSEAGEEGSVSAEPSSETAAADGASTQGTPKKAASQLKSLSGMTLHAAIHQLVRRGLAVGCFV